MSEPESAGMAAPDSVRASETCVPSTSSGSVPPGKAGLDSAAEFSKFSTAFAAGALAFSTGLLGEKIVLPDDVRPWLFAVWVLLAVSLAAGLTIYARIPIMLAEENYDLEDPLFTWPGRVHQISFLLAIIALGFVLWPTLYAGSKIEYRISSAQEALGAVKAALPPRATILRVADFEFINGAEGAKHPAPTWYVQIELETVSDASSSAAKPSVTGNASATARAYATYFVDAKTGNIARVP